MPFTARAQPPDDATGPDRPFEITDNSFLVEEAFNQEAGIFQNILTAVRTEGGRWDAAFTQEWPLGSLRHQISYTIPFAAFGSDQGFGDALINYRYQLTTERAGVPAFSPRLSPVLPTGSDALGAGSAGLQVNLPLSKQAGNLYLHSNAGFTLLPSVGSDDPPDSKVSLFSPVLSGSVIVRVRPMLNLMSEFVWVSAEAWIGGTSTERIPAFTVSPGVRGGWNIGERQIVIGGAMPITFVSDETVLAAFGYFRTNSPSGAPTRRNLRYAASPHTDARGDHRRRASKDRQRAAARARARRVQRRRDEAGSSSRPTRSRRRCPMYGSRRYRGRLTKG